MPVLPWMQGWPFGVPIGHVLLLDAYCGPVATASHQQQLPGSSLSVAAEVAMRPRALIPLVDQAPLRAL
jgi:hypothetical protein